MEEEGRLPPRLLCLEETGLPLNSSIPEAVISDPPPALPFKGLTGGWSIFPRDGILRDPLADKLTLLVTREEP